MRKIELFWLFSKSLGDKIRSSICLKLPTKAWGRWEWSVFLDADEEKTLGEEWRPAYCSVMYFVVLSAHGPFLMIGHHGSRDSKRGWLVHWPPRWVARWKARLFQSTPFPTLNCGPSPRQNLVNHFFPLLHSKGSLCKAPPPPHTHRETETQTHPTYWCYAWNSKNEAIDSYVYDYNVFLSEFVIGQPFCRQQHKPIFQPRFGSGPPWWP